MHAREMLSTHPLAREGVPEADSHGVDTLAGCIAACYDCAQACTACADACLAEADVASLRRCIALNLVCADVCVATGAVASRLTERDTPVLVAQLRACAAACRACAQECERHGHHMEHCRVCATACRECEQACEGVVRRLAARAWTGRRLPSRPRPGASTTRRAARRGPRPRPAPRGPIEA